MFIPAMAAAEAAAEAEAPDDLDRSRIQLLSHNTDSIL